MHRNDAVLLASVLCLAGCASSNEPPEPGARDATSSVERVKAELPTHRERLERVRQAKLSGEVAVAAQSDEGFRARLREEVDRELPEPKARAVARALGRIGLLPEGYDLRAETVDTVAVQAFAYYDPRAKTFYLLKPDAPEAELGPAIVHELDHALQDARFDLEKLRARVTAEDDDDRENALTFLIEGEATYVMNLAALDKAGVPAELADMIVETEGALSRDQLLDKQESAASDKGKAGAALGEATAQARKMPFYVYRTLIEPYTRGAALVSYVKRVGGWPAVDALFRSPPTSTEQCLHPEKLLAGEQPVRIALPSVSLGNDWTVVAEGTLGELGIDCLVREKLGTGHETVAPGWAGDRYRAYGKGDRTAIVWATTWDTEVDAREMETAARELALKDAPRLAPGEVSRVERRGKDVLVLLGAPETAAAGLMEALAAGTKKSR